METSRKLAYRKVMGERLREFRASRGMSLYKVAKQGDMRIDQVKAVEEGDTNYTIDVFLSYISGCDLYMYFAEKSADRKSPHDFEDMAEKSRQNNPRL